MIRAIASVALFMSALALSCFAIVDGPLHWQAGLSKALVAVGCAGLGWQCLNERRG